MKDVSVSSKNIECLHVLVDCYFGEMFWPSAFLSSIDVRTVWLCSQKATSQSLYDCDWDVGQRWLSIGVVGSVLQCHCYRIFMHKDVLHTLIVWDDCGSLSLYDHDCEVTWFWSSSVVRNNIGQCTKLRHVLWC